MKRSVYDPMVDKVAAQLTGCERLVYIELLKLARETDGELSWPIGYRQLMVRTRYRRTAVISAKRRLVALGLIAVLEQGLGRRRTRYRVVLPEVRLELPAVVGMSERPTLSVSDSGQEGAADRHTYTRARSLRGTGLYEVPKYPPTPPPAPPEGGAAESLGCPRAAKRGRRCENCRDCGTTKRQLREKRRRERALAAANERKAAQAAARAAPPPAPDPDRTRQYVAEARAALAAGRVHPPSPPGGPPGADGRSESS